MSGMSELSKEITILAGESLISSIEETIGRLKEQSDTTGSYFISTVLGTYSAMYHNTLSRVASNLNKINAPSDILIMIKMDIEEMIENAIELEKRVLE